MHGLESILKSRVALAILACGAIILVVVLGYLLKQAHDLDVAAHQIASWAATVEAYTQEVQTTALFPDRRLLVEGLHYVDHKNRRFSTLSTTTLTIIDPGQTQSHAFTLKNIAIGDDVYTKIETKSELLAKTIPHSPDWRHFTRTTIPENFQSISIPGPILDNLRLFSEDGSYLTPIEKKDQEELGGGTCTHYLFQLSGKTPEPGGPLPAIIARIGKNGFVDACINDMGAIAQVVFWNDEYFSTTTVRDINNTPPIFAPM